MQLTVISYFANCIFPRGIKNQNIIMIHKQGHRSKIVNTVYPRLIWRGRANPKRKTANLNTDRNKKVTWENTSW